MGQKDSFGNQAVHCLNQSHMKVAAGIGCNIREAVPVRVFIQYIASRLCKCKSMHPEQQCREVVFLGLLVHPFLNAYDYTVSQKIM
jgi:hypothetical protein